MDLARCMDARLYVTDTGTYAIQSHCGLVFVARRSDGLQTVSSANTVVAQTQQRYAIFFINTLDRNALSVTSPLLNWPKYTTSTAQLVNEGKDSNTLIKDDFRSQQYQYWRDNISKFRT